MTDSNGTYWEDSWDDELGFVSLVLPTSTPPTCDAASSSESSDESPNGRRAPNCQTVQWDWPTPDDKQSWPDASRYPRLSRLLSLSSLSAEDVAAVKRRMACQFRFPPPFAEPRPLREIL